METERYGLMCLLAQRAVTCANYNELAYRLTLICALKTNNKVGEEVDKSLHGG